MPRLLVVIIGFVMLALATPVVGVMLCARPRTDGTYNATVKIRELCKPSERQLDPVALGLQGPQGPQGEPGVCECSTTTTNTTPPASTTFSVTSTTCSTVTTGSIYNLCGVNACGSLATCPTGMTCTDGPPCQCSSAQPVPCDQINAHQNAGFWCAAYGACPAGQSCGTVTVQQCGQSILTACACQ
jgi:hypothetical protein